MNAITDPKPKRQWKQSKADFLATISWLKAMNATVTAERDQAHRQAYESRLNVIVVEAKAKGDVRHWRRFAGWYAAASFVFGLLLGVAL